MTMRKMGLALAVLAIGGALLHLMTGSTATLLVIVALFMLFGRRLLKFLTGLALMFIAIG